MGLWTNRHLAVYNDYKLGISKDFGKRTQPQPCRRSTQITIYASPKRQNLGRSSPSPQSSKKQNF